MVCRLVESLGALIAVAGHGTIVCLALPSVNLEEGPDAIADISPAVCFDLAIGAVFDKSVHLGAVGRAEHAGDRHVKATVPSAVR